MPVKSSLLALLLLSCGTALTLAADDYQPGPDSQRQEGVPKGKVVTGKWTSEKVFPGTVRDYWIYTPAQYDGSKPACLMVFQDGGGYVNENGQFRVPVVFDNLIHRKEMPVTIGIFLSPGTIPPAQPGQKDRSNRSFEYDSLGDQYSKFLIDEVLPGLVEKYDLKLTNDPEGRGTCGISSGGICAFTVAWERPDQFRKVISHIGSFTNIRGGHVYPAVIRKTEKKPLRVFLQDGTNDLDNLHGHWPLANQQMASSLKFKEYDYQFVLGDGGHSGKHGGMLLPETLRWLWRDYPK
ncbi:MAG: alpha/beta hydrolase-fold protein [Planctomycetota bacterium]